MLGFPDRVSVYCEHYSCRKCFGSVCLNLTSGVENLILSSKRGLITSASYSSTRESIQQTVDDAYYVSGTLLICMLSNTVAGMCSCSL